MRSARGPDLRSALTAFPVACSHHLVDRRSRGEDIFFFCFYFLQYILGDEFALPSAEPATAAADCAPAGDNPRVSVWARVAQDAQTPATTTTCAPLNDATKAVDVAKAASPGSSLGSNGTAGSRSQVARAR